PDRPSVRIDRVGVCPRSLRVSPGERSREGRCPECLPRRRARADPMSKRFRLRSVAVDNFKAVQKSGAVALTPLTVFIGNNGVGKSSLVEAIETYQEVLLRGLDPALDRWRGIQYVRNQRPSPRRRATFADEDGLAKPI